VWPKNVAKKEGGRKAGIRKRQGKEAGKGKSRAKPKYLFGGRLQSAEKKEDQRREGKKTQSPRKTKKKREKYENAEKQREQGTRKRRFRSKAIEKELVMPTEDHDGCNNLAQKKRFRDS